mmetsp:Transcript_8359/g.21579  ORF Transcript_8359/g.21579 Transcript_8359/m.21579 type:complete len:170 (-) Transcript_8359:57-566(-)
MSPNAPDELLVEASEALPDADDASVVDSPASVAEIELDEELRFRIHRQTVLAAHDRLEPATAEESTSHAASEVHHPDGPHALPDELDEDARFRIHRQTVFAARRRLPDASNQESAAHVHSSMLEGFRPEYVQSEPGELEEEVRLRMHVQSLSERGEHHHVESGARVQGT